MNNMSILSKLIGSSEERQFKRIMERIHREQSPITNLALVIGSSSIACGKAMKPHLNFKTEKEIDAQSVHVCFEFLYFYLHMTMRTGYSHDLGPERARRLKAELGPLVLLPLIDTFFGHWPKDLQNNMVAQFYQKINDAELEYSTCTELLYTEFISEDKNPITGNALFSKLARN